MLPPGRHKEAESINEWGLNIQLLYANINSLLILLLILNIYYYIYIIMSIYYYIYII